MSYEQWPGSGQLWLWQLIDHVLGILGLSILSCETKGWTCSMIGRGSFSSTFIFVQIALGRQGLWKRNISEEASSENQTPKSIIKDLALNKNWPRRKINNRGNHTSGREACCKSFWKTKQYQRAPYEINQTHRLRLKLQDYIMNLEK